MLLHIDGEVVEIRPSELFESKSLVSSRYLELINKPVEKNNERDRKRVREELEDDIRALNQKPKTSHVPGSIAIYPTVSAE